MVPCRIICLVWIAIVFLPLLVQLKDPSKEAFFVGQSAMFHCGLSKAQVQSFCWTSIIPRQMHRGSKILNPKCCGWCSVPVEMPQRITTFHMFVALYAALNRRSELFFANAHKHQKQVGAKQTLCILTLVLFTVGWRVFQFKTNGETNAATKMWPRTSTRKKQFDSCKVQRMLQSMDASLQSPSPLTRVSSAGIPSRRILTQFQNTRCRLEQTRKTGIASTNV